MKAMIFRNLFRPLAERVGTALAVWLVATGWDGQLVDQFVTALVALSAVSADLVFARMSREK